MASDPAPTADVAYRRGTVLGLTLAEIFILLLFLLLLAFLTLVNDLEVERERREASLAKSQETLQALGEWRDVAEVFETPSEVLTLRRQKQRAEERAQRAEDRADLHERQAEALQEVLAQENEAAGEAMRQAQQAERQAAAAERRAAEAVQELHVLQTKGHNPPCWYQVVPAEDGDVREKPYYTLNLGVFDDGIVIRPSAVPPGGAADDNGGSFAAEAAVLGLDDLPYGDMLSDAAVRRHLEPIYLAAKSRQVRSYPCVFWARVWDMTSADAKRRWKRAHDRLIEGMFGAYTVRDDPWPPP